MIQMVPCHAATPRRNDHGTGSAFSRSAFSAIAPDMSSLSSAGAILRVRSVSQLAPRPVAWLWPGRLALGKLAILDGDPGLGKSLVTLDLCARLSTGQPFP